MDGAAFFFHPPTSNELASLFPQFEILGLIGETPGFSAGEAKALAKLNHRGIVTLHEFGLQDGLDFILMEFVDGVNLGQLMQTGRISPREAWPSSRKFATRCNSPTTKTSSTATSSRRTSCSIG